MLNKLATEAAAADSIAREAAERRDAILKSGINYQPEPVPQVATPLDSVPIDRSLVAVTRKVPIPGTNSFREVTTFENADAI
jgi:hypothetical protein